MTALIADVLDHWQALQPIFTIRDDADYDRAIVTLNELLDEVGTNEDHPLYGLLDALGTLIAAYEAEQPALPSASGGEVLAYLMDEHDLHQSDLPEVGSQGVVSEILRGKRKLNMRQVQALSARFNVSPAVFI